MQAPDGDSLKPRFELVTEREAITATGGATPPAEQLEPKEGHVKPTPPASAGGTVLGRVLKGIPSQDQQNLWSEGKLLRT